MLSRVENGGGKKIVRDPSGKLLNEVETISKALYLDKNHSKAAGRGTKTHLPPDPKSGFKYGSEDLSQKGKKSIWNWKPLKAFSNARNKKFRCCFSLQVHSIEGLPLNFENASFCVHWKRRDGELVTRSSKVLDGVAEFEERLTHECVVHGNRSGPHHSAKYEAKHSLLVASVLGATELEVAKHRVDLTRLLPLTLEELEDEKSSGKWTTSFKLSGEAKGATMNVSFGYTVINFSSGNCQTWNDMLGIKQSNIKPAKMVSKFGKVGNKSMIHCAESLPCGSNQHHRTSSKSVDDVKDLHDVLPISRSELVIKVDVVHHRPDEYRPDDLASHKHESDVTYAHVGPVEFHPHPSSDRYPKGTQNQFENSEFPITEQGVILPSNEIDVREVVCAEVARVAMLDLRASSEEIQCQDVGDSSAASHDTEEEMHSKELEMEELESTLTNLPNLGVDVCDSPEDIESRVTVQTNCDNVREGTPLKCDDNIESVAKDFLDMLGTGDSPLTPFGLTSGSEPESPREQLLRQFEKDALAGGLSLFNFGADNIDQADLGFDDMVMHEWPDSCEDLASVIEAFEEYQMGDQAESRKTKAKTLEDSQSAALMQEWGLNHMAFQYSPPKGGGFRSPIATNLEEPHELSPLGERLGSFMKTKNGGFLRFMSPENFKNTKTGGNLVMQVSSPVVVPAEMGPDVTGILRGMASIGIERLSMKANKLMPLEDITGKTMQQVAREVGTVVEGSRSESFLQHDKAIGQDASSGSKKMKDRSSAVSPNKFRSVTADDGSEDAPSNITAKFIGELSALQGKGINVCGSSLCMEGTGDLQLLSIKDLDDEIDGLMGLSLSLDQRVLLDSVDSGDDDHISERTSKILDAHHASSLDRKRGKGSGRKCGLLGNNFTVALLVQLRDPLRNYESVGTPMLTFVQLEKVSELRKNGEEDDECETKVKEQANQETVDEKSLQKEAVPQFRINEVLVSGLPNEPGKKKLWGTGAQQQSGSRWLLANGMGKNNKNPFMKSKAGIKSGDSMRSMSSRGQGSVVKWNAPATSSPHVLNPNVLVPKGIMRLR